MEKYNKKEMIVISNAISPMIYIGINGVHYEKFKQLKLDNEYTPYIISNFGRIFNSKFGKSEKFNVRELRCNSNGTGYVKITLHYNNKPYNIWIHRAVAQSFLKRNKNDTDVNHLDGNKTHNYTWNLEWCTRKENMEHAGRNNLIHRAYGEACNHKYSEKCIIRVCDHIMNNKSPKWIVNECHITKSMFNSVLHYRKWKHVTKNYDFSKYKYLRRNNKVQRLSKAR